MRRAGLVPLVAATVLATAVISCARVPDNGPAVPVAAPEVTQSGEPGSNGVNSGLPRPAADPSSSVSAYINALTVTRNPGPLGDNFLPTPALRNTFRQNPSVAVVRGDIRAIAETPSVADVTTIARFSAELIGTVNSDGVFLEAEDPKWEVQVRMSRARGLWQFAEPPPLIVQDRQFAASFSPATVYFAAKPSVVTGATPRLVIPERRYLNEYSGDRATQIVDLLLAGPSLALESVAQNPLPKIKRTSRVAIENDDLVIELEAQAESVTKDQLNAFVAAVGWSLNDLFSGAVRLIVGGRPVDVNDFSASQDQNTWKRYNPAVVQRALPTFHVQNGAVKVLDPAGGFNPRPLRLSEQVRAKNVRSAAISVDLSRLAVVRTDANGTQRLWIADASGTLQPTLRARDIGRPSWGGNRSTVVVPVGGRLFEVGVGNARTPSEIQVIGPGGRRLTNVTAIRLSLDGVRAVLVNGSGPAAQVYVGTLSGTTGGALVLEARRLAVEGTVKDVSWYGPAQVVVAVTRPGNNGDEVYLVIAPIDGSPAHPQSTRLKATSQVRLTADATETLDAIPLELNGRLYDARADSTSTPALLSAGTAPFYPG
ncbi:LpqB family beta-propeller domain-containing protein [Cryptosporangium minutisporangium]|uniref:GerMN domain-containing protein n=1 Tax=Cryptosporangium minutisporangium TaxID=113569 RepID=A0ABP6T3M3_9ACTN